MDKNDIRKSINEFYNEIAFYYFLQFPHCDGTANCYINQSYYLQTPAAACCNTPNS